jgi:hypothetical protein
VARHGERGHRRRAHHVPGRPRLERHPCRTPAPAPAPAPLVRPPCTTAPQPHAPPAQLPLGHGHLRDTAPGGNHCGVARVLPV